MTLIRLVCPLVAFTAAAARDVKSVLSTTLLTPIEAIHEFGKLLNVFIIILLYRNAWDICNQLSFPQAKLYFRTVTSFGG